MSARRLIAVAAVALLTASCGGGSPTGPPPPRELYDVVAVVFLDENANGTPEADEGARIPGVELSVAGGRGRSETLSGRVVISGVPAGVHAVRITASTLPPFYQAGRLVTVTVPQPAGSDAFVPVVLPIGSNRPYDYMAFGDSITVGDGSSDGLGYRGLLQADLRGYFGRGNVVARAVEGTRSEQGAARIESALASARPAFTLILYGTNDWNDFFCKTAFPCYTVDSLRKIVQSAKAHESHPFLATIPPANPDFPRQVPPSRNDWVARMNDLIRPMAQEEGAVLVDIHAAFLKQGDITQLFSDHVHPNDRGYAIIADEFFKAVTQPAAAPGMGDEPAASFAFDPPPPAARLSHLGRTPGPGPRRQEKGER